MSCVRAHLHPVLDILAFEKRLQQQQLGQHAADRPDVDWWAVMPCTKQKFRCAVPKLDDSACQAADTYPTQMVAKLAPSAGFELNVCEEDTPGCQLCTPESIVG
eukprot:3467099-Pleurochrysis_carterae.AAC.1